MAGSDFQIVFIRLLLLLNFSALVCGSLVFKRFDQHDQISILGRAAYVYKPNTTSVGTGKKLSVVLVLHGSDETATDWFDKGFEESADLHNFLVVYPEMTIPGGQTWGYKADIPYFSGLLNHLENNYGFDGKSAFVCGHSAGGSMSLFLQNEMQSVCGAGSVEAAVGHLDQWDLSKRGKPTMIVWNHADPVLKIYAPNQDERAYYNMTVSTLRRHGTQYATSRKVLPASSRILFAEQWYYPKDTAPFLTMLSFESNPGTHAWAHFSWSTFSATEKLMEFFLTTSCNSQPEFTRIIM